MIPKQELLLSHDEFHTMLFYSVRMVNLTLLHEDPDSPDDSKTIMPHDISTEGRLRPSKPHSYH